MSTDRPGGGSSSTPNIHHLFDNGNPLFSGPGLKIALGLAFVVVLGLWLSAGVFKVQPSEQAVITTFGKFSRTESPGLRFRWPWPIESHVIVPVKSINQIEIGFRRGEGKATNVEHEAVMLTEDENIVQVHLSVQYQIADAAAYLFRVKDPDEMLRTAAETSLRSVVGSFPIDATMTDQRGHVQDEIRTELERLLNEYGTGLRIVEVRIIKVDPPEKVKDAFHDVVRAREDGQRQVRAAEGEASQLIPEAEARKLEMVAEAEGTKEQRIREARGDAQRFRQVFEAFKESPRITRERLYLESIKRALATAEKIVLPEQVTGQVLPWMFMRQGARPSPPGPPSAGIPSAGNPRNSAVHGGEVQR